MSSGSIALPTIYVGAPPPPANDLPGSGSASDAANGQRFTQIQQDLNRALTANRPSPQQVVQGLNDTMSAQADARAAQQQSQFEANMTAAAKQRAASPPPAPAAPVAGMPSLAPPPPEADRTAASAFPDAAAAGLAVAAPAAAGAGEGGLAAALPSAGQVLGAVGDVVGGLVLRGGVLAGAVLGLGTGNIPSDTEETAMRAETEARLRATGAMPGPEAATPAPSPQVPPVGEAVPSLQGGFGPVPSFVVASPAFDAPGAPATTLPYEASLPPATLTPPAALAPATDGGAGALPGFTPGPLMPGLEGLTPHQPGGYGLVPGFVAAPPQGVTLPGVTLAPSMAPLPGFAPADPGQIGPQSFANGAVTREQALAEVRADAARDGIEIMTDADPEVKRYMDDAARREGIDPDALHALTLGDMIFVREARQDDVRVLREELIHTAQQRGMEIGVDTDPRTSSELDAREELLKNAERWALTPEEINEIQQEIIDINSRGKY
ncbi:hypothetical protein [uncultured Methylobacterium sp.]|uniref:hypothetical protein n=1 Tax=uncultured Methylobacterium sp. TaxID=157278 RepID=UPI002595DE2E|nr:hypothetical protein [uncultured Methylobacterium sp.]